MELWNGEMADVLGEGRAGGVGIRNVYSYESGDGTVCPRSHCHASRQEVITCLVEERHGRDTVRGERKLYG